MGVPSSLDFWTLCLGRCAKSTYYVIFNNKEVVNLSLFQFLFLGLDSSSEQFGIQCICVLEFAHYDLKGYNKNYSPIN